MKVGHFQTLIALNPDPQARLHLDSNGTLLTPDYIDQLAREAGVADIGVEPRGVGVPTFQRVTGAADTELAGRYLETAWQAVEYMVATYPDWVFCISIRISRS
jgi:pyruvate formate lyase activating enzyme